MAYIYKPKEFVLSNSSFNRGEECAKKLFVSKFFPKEERKFEGVPAAVGHALHIGAQNFIEFNDRDKAFFAMMMNYPLEENPDPKDYRSLEACYATLDSLITSPYLQQHEAVWINVGNERKCAVEVPFKIHIKGAYLDKEKTIPVVYIGFIDAILFDRVSGDYIVVDFKTHRNNRSNDLSGEYIYDGQCLPYGLALEQLLGHDVKHGLEVRYISVYIDTKEPAVRQYPVRKTYQDIQNWVHKLHLECMQYAYMFQNEFWPRTNNGRNCMNWNSKCPVLDYCSLDDPTAIYRHIYTDTPPEKVEALEKVFNPWIEFNLEAA